MNVEKYVAVESNGPVVLFPQRFSTRDGTIGPPFLFDAVGVIRVDKRAQFTVVSQDSIRDAKLSLKARGLLLYLLSFPDDWEFNIKHIISSLPDGRTAVQSALAELVALGYATLERPRKSDGTMSGTTYLVHESPRNRKPDSRSVGPRNRETDNRVLGDILNTKEEPNTERHSLTSFESDARARKSKPKKEATPSSVEDAIAYFVSQRSSEIEARKFFDHFTANGWKVSGRAAMKDWQAAARNWIRNAPQFNRATIDAPAIPRTTYKPAPMPERTGRRISMDEIMQEYRKGAHE